MIKLHKRNAEKKAKKKDAARRLDKIHASNAEKKKRNKTLKAQQAILKVKDRANSVGTKPARQHEYQKSLRQFEKQLKA